MPALAKAFRCGKVVWAIKRASGTNHDGNNAQASTSNRQELCPRSVQGNEVAQASEPQIDCRLEAVIPVLRLQPKEHLALSVAAAGSVLHFV